LKEVKTLSLSLTKDVLKHRETLTHDLCLINHLIWFGLDLLESIRDTVKVVKNHQRDLDANANFKISVKKPGYTKIDLEGTGKHTTTCLICNFTCHEDCPLRDNDQKANCCVMNQDGKNKGYFAPCARTSASGISMLTYRM
jgi:hypothetical protein